jgi:hypothetical protein
MSKKVLCSNCGFLCWDVSDYRDAVATTIRWGEIYHFNRKKLVEGTIKAIDDDTELNESYHLSCLRKQWIWSPGNTDTRYNFVGFGDLQASRKCVYYFKYVPGSGPEEHKELKRESDTTRVIRNATLWGAVVGGAMGAAGAIAAQLIYAAFTAG